MNKSEAVALVAVLAASYPKQQIGEATIEAYALGLIDLDVREATTAVRTLQQGSRFFPTIAEIREMVAELSLGAPTPMLAFESARNRGPRHPIVGRARRIVGDDFHWRETPSGFLQKAFLAAYTEAKAEAVREIATPALAEAGHAAIPAPEALALVRPTEGLAS